MPSTFHEWEAALRKHASTIAGLTGLNVVYKGRTDEEPLIAHPQARGNRVDIILYIGPAGTGILSDGYEFTSGYWYDGWASRDQNWDKFYRWDIQFDSLYVSTNPFSSYEHHLMYYLGYAMGLNWLLEDSDTEIMTWGKFGSGTEGAPDWGPGCTSGWRT